MLSDGQCRRLYWDRFLLLKKEMSYLPPAKRCDLWLIHYSTYCEGIRLASGEQLSELIVTGHVLLHPDFSVDREENEFRKSLDSRRRMVVLPEEKDGDCRLSVINGEECIFNQYTRYRGDLVGDHIWPYSLGGPSNSRSDLTRNRAMLCKNCNSAKSSGIHVYHWKVQPWLDERLHNIARRMRVE